MKSISLENFNAKSTKEPILNSPRSLEACRRQGILPKELLIRTLDEIKETYGDNKLDREGLELIAQHYEERRREKIRVLLEERAQIIEDEKDGLISFSPRQEGKSKSQMSIHQSKSNFKSSMGSAVDSTLIDRERKQLERIKQRQEKEIRQMVDYELKMADIKKVQEEKLEFQRQRERKREHELALKRKEQEEIKMRQEEEKRRQAELEEEMRRQRAAEEFRKEQEKANLEKQRERQRKLEARQREEEQKQKHEEFVKETEKKLLEQQMMVEHKKKVMEEKDKIRQENLKEQRLLQQHEAEERRRYHEEKLKQAKEKNDEIIYQKKLEYEERQARNEEKRRQFERELEQKTFENRQRAEEKAELIKTVLAENRKIEEKRKDEYYYKKKMAEERKQELDRIAERERQRKLKEQRDKDNQRKQVKENMELRLQDRVGGFLSKMAESEAKVERAQREKDEYLRHKHALEIIKKNDKLENVQRMARIQEYQKEKLLEKINDDTERANQIRDEKNNLLNMRMGVRREMEESKRSLMDRFDLVKRGKLNPEVVSAEFGRSQSQMGEQGGSRFGNSTRSREQLHSQQGRAIQSAELTGNGGFRSNNLGNASKKPKKEDTLEKLKDNMKARQSQEMLKLLEEEQNKENERELILQKQKDQKERERVEKSFAIERAKANQRIQNLADKHDDEIVQLMKQYNAKKGKNSAY